VQDAREALESPQTDCSKAEAETTKALKMGMDLIDQFPKGKQGNMNW